MFEYQDEGVAWLRGRPRALLADDPGLGKTRQLLLAAEGKTLVVAPAMVLDGGVWEDEISRWRPDLDVTAVSYSSLCERERTSKSGTRPLPRAKPEFRSEHWDTLIFDEAHYLKGRRTKWSLAARQLKHERLFLATGTPIPNWAYELWVLLFMLYPGDRRYTSYWRWVRSWFRVWKPPWGGMKIEGLLPGKTWQDFYDQNLDGVYLRRRRDDVLRDLPPLTEQTVRAPMVPKQRRVYETLKEDYIAWIEQTGTEVVAWHAGALTTKLAKICTGLEIEDPNATGSGKLAVLGGLLEDRQQPTLVVSYFRASAYEAETAARKAGLSARVITGSTPRRQRGEIVRGFQAGDFDVLCATIDTIGEGLTLTRADCVIFLERSWRPSKNEQALRRIHRIGQTRPVTAIHVVAENTIDERIIEVLRDKTDEQVAVLDARRVIELL